MRLLITACALVVLGLAASIPFRRSASENSSPSAQIASGPLGSQLATDSSLTVTQWIDRSTADPAIAWQSQPMSFERDAHALELPEMPPEFSFDEVDKAIPQPIHSRFSAAAAKASDHDRPTSATATLASEPSNLQAPPLASEPLDPLPSAMPSRTHELTVQGVSGDRSMWQTTVMRPPLPNEHDRRSTGASNESSQIQPQRHYIREPD